MFDTHPSDEILYEYLDGQLDPENFSTLKNHFAGCQECSSRFIAFERLFAEIESLPEIPLNKDFSTPVLKKIRPSPALPRKWKWALIGQFALTGLVLTFVLPIFIRSESFITISLFGEKAINQLFLNGSVIYGQGLTFINGLSTKLLELIYTLQNPNLSLSLFTVIPVLIATGVLWLVGNSLLLRNQLSGPK